MKCACGSIRLGEVTEGFRCEDCGGVIFWNPPTIATGVIPIEDWRSSRTGALLIERSDGGLAFPGGFQGREDILAAVSREVQEETGILLPEEDWEYFDFRTTPDLRYNLFFALYTGLLTQEHLAAFLPNAEAVRLVTVTAPVPMKFPLHEKVLRKFFELQQAMCRFEARTAAAAAC